MALAALAGEGAVIETLLLFAGSYSYEVTILVVASAVPAPVQAEGSASGVVPELVQLTIWVFRLPAAS